MFWLYVAGFFVVLFVVSKYLGRRGSKYLRNNIGQDERNRVNDAHASHYNHIRGGSGTGGLGSP